MNATPTPSRSDLDAIERDGLSLDTAHALAAEVRALRERVAYLEKSSHFHKRRGERFRVERNEARERVATLEGRLHEVVEALDAVMSFDSALYRRSRLGVGHKKARALLDASPPSVAEMAGSFEGGPDSVEWLRQQRGDTDRPLYSSLEGSEGGEDDR